MKIESGLNRRIFMIGILLPITSFIVLDDVVLMLEIMIIKDYSINPRVCLNFFESS